MLDDTISLDSVNDFVEVLQLLLIIVWLPLIYLKIHGTDNFQFSTITSSTVYAMLFALDVRKSVGPDGISARFFKEIAEVVAEPLTKLLNKSLQSGVSGNGIM